MLWRCWLGGRKGIRPVKNWVVRCWRGNLSGARCRLATCIWPSWCHCHSLSLASVKSRLVLPFWYRPTRVVPEKGPLNGCMYVIVSRITHWGLLPRRSGVVCVLVTTVIPATSGWTDRGNGQTSVCMQARGTRYHVLDAHWCVDADWRHLVNTMDRFVRQRWCGLSLSLMSSLVASIFRRMCWFQFFLSGLTQVRPHIGANGVSWPPGKMDEKLKSKNEQKRAVFYVYVIFWEQSGQAGVENGAILTTHLFRYTSECTTL